MPDPGTAHSLLPWLAPLARQLAEVRARDRLPHAILVHEAPGAGGAWLARWTLRLLFCSAGSARPCGSCRDCAQVSAGQHPDCLFVHPLEDSRQIRIDQVRELARELALTSHGGGYKAAVIAPADALNVQAANALLKTLEEPPARTLLVLVCTQPSRLPATILSRCLRLRAAAPSREECARWLAGSVGPGNWAAAIEVLGAAPLLLAQSDPQGLARLHEDVTGTLAGAIGGSLDPGQTAERWGRGADYELRLLCIENWLTDRIRRAAAQGRPSPEMRSGAHLSESASDLNIRSLFELLDESRELRALADTPLNRTLALERLFWKMMGMRPRGRARL